MDTRRLVRSPSTGLRGSSQQHGSIWPIKDTSHRNERRKKTGSNLNVEQNAQHLNTPHHVLTLEDVRELLGYLPSAP